MRNSQAVTPKFFSALFVAAFFVFGAQSYGQTPAPNSATASAAKPVVVELFTAEGCSDCPPAEALALRMEKQPIPGVDLIVLEEHVDYWNQYGWYDPFSSAASTARQDEYVRKTKSPTPYTPEMVIDGQAQFPGANVDKAQAAIDAAAKEPDTSVTITEDNLNAKGDGEFKITVGKLDGSAPRNEVEVWLAVTEDGLHSAVKAGENAGHTLYHAAVVRYLHKIGAVQDAGFSGDARVKINSHWDRKNINIVAFVQDKKSLKIIGAAQVKLTS
ncbi:MAG TPA: DUF1223 domain-containing protein [Candidatus Acidoferrales bacterium]|nr:DUF1223 domain-containing protein [Candidatus Acidoferrales bacterium]